MNSLYGNWGRGGGGGGGGGGGRGPGTAAFAARGREAREDAQSGGGEDGTVYQAPVDENTLYVGEGEDGPGNYVEDAMYPGGNYPQSWPQPTSSTSRRRSRRSGGRSGRSGRGSGATGRGTVSARYNARHGGNSSSASSSGVVTTGASAPTTVTTSGSRSYTTSASRPETYTTGASAPTYSTAIASNYSFNGYGASQGVLAGRHYWQKDGSGGYSYQQFDDGGIRVAEGSPARVGQYIPPFSSEIWYAITKEIGARAPDKARVAAHFKKSPKLSIVSNNSAPTSVIVTKNPKGLNALFAALGAGSAVQGQALVAQAAVAHGPEVAEAAQEYFNERNSSPAAIQKKIDKTEIKLAAAKAKGDHVKAKKLQAKLVGLQKRLADAQSDVDSGDIVTTSGERGTFPWKYVIGGLVGFGILAVIAKSLSK